MFEISVEYSFAAGHALRGYKGKCENVHGRNYKVQVTVADESAGRSQSFVATRLPFIRLQGFALHRDGKGGVPKPVEEEL